MINQTEEYQSIRILIADDHAVVREGLRTLINTEPGMIVIGEAQDGNQAVQQSVALQPDVILLDMVMPHKSGLEVIEEVRQENPQARILVLTSFAGDDVVFPAIKSGALGYLLKNSSPAAPLARYSRSIPWRTIHVSSYCQKTDVGDAATI